MKSRTRRFSSLALRRRRLLYRRLTIVLIFAAIFFTTLVWLMTRPQFGINSIAIIGASDVHHAALEANVRNELSGFYLGIIPRSLSFFYPKDTIVKNLLDTFTGLKEVSVERDGLQALIVHVKERAEEARWCRGVHETEVCFRIDENGLVFAAASENTSDAVSIIYRGFLDKLEDPIGATYLSEIEFKRIGFLLGSLKATGLAATEFLRSGDGEYIITLERGSKLLLKEDSDFNRALSNLSSLLNDPELKSLFEETPLPFEYFDLRLANKVFYKRL